MATPSTDAPPPSRVVPPSRRRDKPILSCNLCRRRKLKCDRQQPCKTCVDRGLSLSCTYSRHPPSPAHEPKTQVHDRIDQLEKLVTSLMDAKNGDHPNLGAPSHSSAGPPSTHRLLPSDPSTDGEIPGSPDRVKLESDATSYTNSGHWTSILDGIAELREQLDEIPTTALPRDPTQSEIVGPDLLFGRQRHATKQEILAAIPPRTEADKLIATYFTAMDMAYSLIHKPTFLRQYNEFWEHPFETPVMWIGFLYSVFTLATRFQVVDDDYPNGIGSVTDTSLRLGRIDFYCQKIVQCLVLANYSNCPPYTIETFLQYFVAETFRSQDGQFGTWILAGMIVRMAFRMGYHCEPSRFPNISPFQAEMRRRLWSTIVQLDLKSSSHVGLPRMIQPTMFDVMEPRNLADEDMNEDTVELPPSRPHTDATPMLYLVIRNRVHMVFARILDVTNAPTRPAYQNVMELDSALRSIYDDIPESMKAVRVMDFECVDSHVAMRRLFLGLAFLKAELMLHRPFLLLGRTDPVYEYSRSVCLDAALGILEFQRQLDTELRPGGKMWSSRWRLWSVGFRLSFLATHDFLLATTVLALDLDRDLADPMPVSENNITNRVRFKTRQAARIEIVEALTVAYDIWVRASEKSREAQKVAAAVKLVLGKANANTNAPTATHESLSAEDAFSIFVQQCEQDKQAVAIASSTFFDIDNPHFNPPFPMNDIPTDFGNVFDWEGLEPDFPIPIPEPTLQDTLFS